MKKVLIVDDEPSIRFLISSALEDEGYHLFEAGDGIEAFQIVEKETPDLIILDIMIPGMNGYELCQRLKLNANTRKIIIVLLTARGQEKDRIQSQQVQADYYIKKPFSPMELIDLVAAALGN